MIGQIPWRETPLYRLSSLYTSCINDLLHFFNDYYLLDQKTKRSEIPLERPQRAIILAEFNN